MSDLPNPGDLAYIVRDVSACQENIGAVVQVLQDQRTPLNFYPADEGEVWITSKRSLAAVDMDWTKSHVRPGYPLTIPRVWLRRIAGPSTPTETTTDFEVTA